MDYEDILAEPERFVHDLEWALRESPLPGLAAHKKMASPNRQWTPPEGAQLRQSAVLALLHPSPEGIALLFTLRPTHLAHHGGQVCLPGGGHERIDATLIQTALRETQEELGMLVDGVQVLGRLTSLYIASSQNLVHPCVGWVPSLPLLHPDSWEVEAVLEIHLRTLLDPATLGSYAWQLNGKVVTVPSYVVAPYHIWGATAMMISELLEIVRGMNHMGRK